MNWRASLSKEEIEEMYEDSCSAYNIGVISLNDLKLALGKLGYNATEIEDAEKFYRPSPPENGEEDGS